MYGQTLVTKFLVASVSANVINLGLIATADAAALISVDTDPLTPGIQSSLNVDLGDTFTVEVIISDDAIAPTPTIFNAVILEAFFNDAGAVLGLGPTGAIAGSLAGTTAFTFDAISTTLVTPGASLTQGASTLGGGFTSGSGAVGLLGVPFFTVGAVSQSIFSLDFTALYPGTSTILAGGTSPFGVTPLALTGSLPFQNHQLLWGQH